MDGLPNNLRKLRILLVEDHRDSRWILTRALARSGHEVNGTRSVEEAIETLSRQTFDALICDISLGDGTGWDILQRLRELRIFPPPLGIALTGYGGEMFREHSRARVSTITWSNRAASGRSRQS